MINQGYTSEDRVLTPKKLYNRLKSQLELPIVDSAIYNGYKTVTFDLKNVYKHLVDRKWVKGIIQKKDNSLVIKELVNNMVEHVIDQVEIDSLF